MDQLKGDTVDIQMIAGLIVIVGALVLARISLDLLIRKEFVTVSQVTMEDIVKRVN